MFYVTETNVGLSKSTKIQQNMTKNSILYKIITKRGFYSIKFIDTVIASTNL